MKVRLAATLPFLVLAFVAGGGCDDSSDGGMAATSGSSTSSTTGTPPVFPALGLPCESDADCVEGQTCHEDTETYLGHKQCTAPCTYSDECWEAFGLSSGCVSGFCLPECDGDAECPEGTLCVMGGNCVRTGPDSGNPYCEGTPASCSSLTGGCGAVPGCSTQGGGCEGDPYPCAANLQANTPALCESIDGCVWYDGIGCGGYTTGCSAYGGETCDAHFWCDWTDPVCGGAPSTDCLHLSVASCAAVPGCSVVMP